MYKILLSLVHLTFRNSGLTVLRAKYCVLRNNSDSRYLLDYVFLTFS
jgi:hypothetical protein